MALHLRGRRARQPLGIFRDGRRIPHRMLADEELDWRVREGPRFPWQTWLELLEEPGPGDDLTYAWDRSGLEVWVRWPSPGGGFFVMQVERG